MPFPNSRLPARGRRGCRISGRVPALAVFLTLLLNPMSEASAQSSTPVQRHGQLAVKGNRIVDKDGVPVALRGMSLYWSQWRGQFYNAGVVRWLRDDWKCTVVRASMAVENGGYLTNADAEKNKVKTVVQAAIDNGLYVIIDWHDHNAHQHTAQAKGFFEEMARTYGQHPNVIYEPFNEPLDTHSWPNQIKPYHQTLVAAIRAIDPDNLIILGTRTWSQDVDLAAQDPVAGTNLAYTLHYYAATHKQFQRNKATLALSRGVALFVTEYGTAEASGNGALDAAETRRWWDFLDQNAIGHCNWSIADITETTAALRPGASSNGGWAESQLSASGVLVRNELRAKDGKTTSIAARASAPVLRTAAPGAYGPIWGAPMGQDGRGRITLWRDARGRLLTIAPLPTGE